MSEGLAGTVAIVTGGGGGIGAATVARLRALACRAISFDLRPGDGGGMIVDVTDPAAIDAAVAAVAAQHGRLDFVVNNAGGGPRGSIETLARQDWQASLALNLSSAFHVIQAAVPHIRAGGRGGAIVNVASLAGRTVSPVGGIGYAAAKAGLLGLTRQAAGELLAARIRVNAVCPGPTRTGLTRNSTRRDADMPLGRWIEPDDIAHAIVHLLGPQSGACTGSVIDIDGGLQVAAAASANPA